MLKRLLAVAVAAFGVAGSAKADFTIDNFTTPSPAAVYVLAGAVGSTYSNTTSLGGGVTRQITVTQTANVFGTSGATGGLFGSTVVGGRFVLSTSAGATSYASLLYTYATPLNLSTAGSAVQFDIPSADVNTPLSVRISDGTKTGTQVGSVTSSSVGTFTLPISAFGINFANVTSIELLLNRNATTGASAESADVTLAQVRVLNPAAPTVPAPPAVALLALALPAVGIYRRKKAGR